MMYHCRLAPVEGDDQVTPCRINEFFSRYSMFFAVSEFGGKKEGLHYHVLFETGMSETDLRLAIAGGVNRKKERVTGFFEGVGASKKGGTGRYQLKKADVPDDDKWKPWRYLCKGDGPADPPDVVCGQPPIGKSVNDLHAEFWKENKQLRKEAAKARAEAKATVMEAAVLHFSTYMWSGNFRQDVQAIWAFFVEDKIVNNKLTSETIISQYVTTIINRFFPDKKLRFIQTQTQKTLEKYGDY